MEHIKIKLKIKLLRRVINLGQGARLYQRSNCMTCCSARCYTAFFAEEVFLARASTKPVGMVLAWYNKPQTGWQVHCWFNTIGSCGRLRQRWSLHCTCQVGPLCSPAQGFPSR